MTQILLLLELLELLLLLYVFLSRTYTGARGALPYNYVVNTYSRSSSSSSSSIYDAFNYVIGCMLAISKFN